jgi:hypothetical protein
MLWLFLLSFRLYRLRQRLCKISQFHFPLVFGFRWLSLLGLQQGEGLTKALKGFRLWIEVQLLMLRGAKVLHFQQLGNA